MSWQFSRVFTQLQTGSMELETFCEMVFKTFLVIALAMNIVFIRKFRENNETKDNKDVMLDTARKRINVHLTTQQKTALADATKRFIGKGLQSCANTRVIKLASTEKTVVTSL